MIQELDIADYKKYFNDIVRLLSELKRDEKSLKKVMNDLERYLISNQAIIGGHIINNKLVSFVWAHERFYSNEYRMHLSYVIVDKDQRGKGYSKELLQFITNKARSLDIFKLDLNVAPTNNVSISLYENFGFDTEKYLMSKNLKEE